MDTDTSRGPEDDDLTDDEGGEEDDGGKSFPFDPRGDDDTPLGSTDELSDADA